MEPARIPQISGLTSDTANILHEIDLESNSPAWTEKQFKEEFLNKHALIYGVKLLDVLVGFLVCHVIDNEAHIVNFGVREGNRGKGLGKKLAQYLLDELLRRAVRIVTLEVRSSNLAALGLYASLGFTKRAIRERFYSSNDEDALLLGLDLLTSIKDPLLSGLPALTGAP